VANVSGSKERVHEKLSMVKYDELDGTRFLIKVRPTIKVF